MDLQKILIIIQLVIGLLMSAAILIQNRGASLGSAFGGGDAFHTTRRGAEKVLHNITIVLSVLFVALSFVMILL